MASSSRRPVIRNKSPIVAARRRARKRAASLHARRMSSPFASPFVSPREQGGSHEIPLPGSPQGSPHSSKVGSPCGSDFRIDKFDNDESEYVPELTPFEILQNFVKKILNQKLLQPWNMWTDYVKRHRMWEKNQIENRLSIAMVKLTNKHAPGERSEAVLDELCKWALSDAGPPILRKLDANSELRETVQQMIVQNMEAGEVLFLQGQKGAHFWFVAKGQIKIFVEDNEDKALVKVSTFQDPSRGRSFINEIIQSPDHGEEYLGREVARVGKGRGFGELALFEGDGRRNASAASGKRTIMVAIPKEVYLKTIARFHIEARQSQQKMEFLLKLPLFSSWSRRRVVDTSFTLTVQEYPRGTTIFAQNTPTKQLMFIRTGKVVLHHKLRPMRPGEASASRAGVSFCEGKRLRGWKCEPIMKLAVLGPGKILGLVAPLLTKALEKERIKSERDKKNSDVGDANKKEEEVKEKPHGKHHYYHHHHHHERVDPKERYNTRCKRNSILVISHAS